MRTYHHLPRTVVSAHLHSFGRTLLGLGAEMPTLWCPITPAGTNLCLTLAKRIKTLQDKVELLPASFEPTRRSVRFLEGDPNKDIPARKVLIIDYSVTQDGAMLAVLDAVNSYHPAGVTTYAVVVPRRASLIPNHWGLMVDANDRVRLLDCLPVGRLSSNPYLTIRKLLQSDTHAHPLKSGVPSLDRITWADRYYDMVNSADERTTYLLVLGATVAGYVTCHLHRRDCLMLDEVVVGNTHKGQGHGATLMRFLDATATAAGCRSTILWSIAEQVKFYRKFGFKPVPQEQMTLDGEKYVLMLKPFRPDESNFACQWLP